MRIQRFEQVDALRGLAMLWMTFFHFSFDLNYFGMVKQDFYRDPVWTWQRTLIVSLFLLCAGAGQALAVAQGQSWQRFWRRWGLVAACALLVTLGSWLMYPNSFIYFGVLHGIALMLIVVRLTASWGRWLWLLGALAIASKFIAFYALQTSVVANFSQVMNSPAWNWIGWISAKPITEDYVPLFPWLGVMWWGMAGTQWVLVRQPSWLSAKPQGIHRILVLLGRWSLSYYMLHQPILLGALMAISWLKA